MKFTALQQETVSVSGTISASGYKVWVNGIAVAMNGTNWAAADVPVTPGEMNGYEPTNAAAVP